MASIFANFTPNEEEILGATCLILWGLTTIVMVKYCLFIMMLDDNGEGGTKPVRRLFLSLYVFVLIC
jgi:K+ transporter